MKKEKMLLKELKLSETYCSVLWKRNYGCLVTMSNECGSAFKTSYLFGLMEETNRQGRPRKDGLQLLRNGVASSQQNGDE